MVKGYVAPNILSLVLQAKAKLGLTNEGVAQAANMPQDSKGQAIIDTLKRQHGIHVNLVNWALAQTLAAEDPVEAALAQLERAALSPEQLAALRTTIVTFREANAEGARPRRAAGASKPPASSPHKSDPLQLTPEEGDALLAWLGDQAATMPIERPLTRAIRKIAMREDRDSVPPGPPAGSGTAAASGATGAGSAPSAAVPSPPRGRRKKKDRVKRPSP